MIGFCKRTHHHHPKVSTGTPAGEGLRLNNNVFYENKIDNYKYGRNTFICIFKYMSEHGLNEGKIQLIWKDCQNIII